MHQYEYTPLVSIIIPAYNHEKYIEEAIKSVGTDLSEY
jgi:glycosyltransferase involved in cell wall biosynthesis